MPKVRTDESGPDRTARNQAAKDNVRMQVARVVRIVFGVLAAILAIGALLVVLRANINQDNPVVKFVTDVADGISGPFSRDNGVFDFGGKHAESKNVLLNWGLAAIIYLLIGRFLAQAIEPKRTR